MHGVLCVLWRHDEEDGKSLVLSHTGHLWRVRLYPDSLATMLLTYSGAYVGDEGGRAGRIACPHSCIPRSSGRGKTKPTSV